jgi:hypothetical protein
LGRLAARIVEAVVFDHHLGAAGLDIVPAHAELKPALAQGKRAVIADVDRVRAACRILAGSKPAKGRAGDVDTARRVVGGENALLAVLEPRVGNIERTFLQSDAGAIAVRHLDVRESDPSNLSAKAV